jgi:SpoVK/Ycf46/Vps4 family AAA+-type ATPase
MQIIDKEVEKTKEIFKILELPEKAVKEHTEKLKNALLMDMVAEAYAEKGQMMEDASFTQDDIEDFLTDNYEEGEIEEILSRVSRDVIVEYFSKILKSVTEDKLVKVNDILAAKFE